MKTGIIILAAGESSRMGQPKQLLMHRGRTLLDHAVATAHALSCAPVAVVLGAHAERIRPRLREPRVIVAENPAWREGMGGSLSTGMRALTAAHPALSAVIVMLCDQPFVTAETLRALVAAHLREDAGIVASEYGDSLGVPALFTRAMFAELLALDGDEGARSVIRAHREHVATVAVPDGAFDVDTPGDYARLRLPFSEPRILATV